MGKLTTLSEMQLDAIGEIMNISMGSAATAVSELLNAKVVNHYAEGNRNSGIRA